MKAHFSPTIWVTLAVLVCPKVATATASAPQTRGSAVSANIPASALSPAGTLPQQSGDRGKAAPFSYAADASRRAQLMKLFDASFNDRQRRMERCTGIANVGPPQPYRWVATERWWENGLGFFPPDQLGPGFDTRVVQNQSFSTYLYCLQNSPH